MGRCTSALKGPFSVTSLWRLFGSAETCCLVKHSSLISGLFYVLFRVQQVNSFIQYLPGHWCKQTLWLVHLVEDHSSLKLLDLSRKLTNELLLLQSSHFLCWQAGKLTSLLSSGHPGWWGSISNPYLCCPNVFVAKNLNNRLMAQPTQTSV